MPEPKEKNKEIDSLKGSMNQLEERLRLVETHQDIELPINTQPFKDVKFDALRKVDQLELGEILNKTKIRVYLSSNQTLTGASTTQVALDTESFDIRNEFDTSAYRFTPTEEGYYHFEFKIYHASTASFVIRIQKNGSNYNSFRALTRGYSETASDIVYMNGTTDYLEVYIENLLAGAITATSGVDGTTLSIHKIN